MGNLVVTTFATKRYTYALNSCLRRIAAAVQEPAHLVVVHDGTDEVRRIASEAVEKWMPRVTLHEVTVFVDDEVVNYSQPAQMLVARLQEAGFAKARALDADWCWCVESDVLVPADGLTFSRAQLQAFAGYYDVAMVTYPNGDFLGGHGTPQQAILPSAYEDERTLPETLPEDPQERAKAVEASPPKGNIWELNASGWRKRGWLSWAYPAIGRGAVLPTDWVGLGCTLLSRKALSLATFDGYDGRGTQDLFLCWRRWHPAGLRMCVITHTVASHVTRKRNEDGTQDYSELTLFEASHEQVGECAGHLRVRAIPWEPT